MSISIAPMAYLGFQHGRARRRRRRGRCGVVEGPGAWAPPRKNHFCPQNDKFGVHFDADFKRQKTRTVTKSLGTRILRFNCETKLTMAVQNYQKNSRSDQTGGAVAPSPP